MNRLIHLGLMLVVVIAWSGGLIRTAAAHADFVRSNPAAGSRLDTAPTSVTIVFSEELKSTGNLIKVTDVNGQSVDQGNTALDTNDPDRKTLTVGLVANLPNAVYTVNWSNVADDGDASSGSFTFGVGTTPPISTLPATGSSTSFALLGFLALVLLGVGSIVRRQPVEA